MNLIWHIVKKDLRRFGLLIVLLALALAAKAEFLAIASDARTASNLTYDAHYLKTPVALNSVTALYLICDLDMGSRTKTIMLGIFCASDFALLIMLVLGVLVEDPTLGERTFWRTRPIAGWQMLAAKAVFIFLIGWPLQAAMQVMLNLNIGTPGGHWYSDVCALALTQAVWISVLALSAVLWRNPLVGAGSLIICCIVLVYGMTFILEAVGYNPSMALEKHAAAVGFVWWGAAILVPWWMYCHRRRHTGFLILAAPWTVIALLLFL